MPSTSTGCGTKRLRRHWPNTSIVWRGDSHYGRVEAMEWAEDDGVDYIFGLAGNATLDALVAATADNLRFHHARSSQTKLRTYVSVTYQAGSWTRPRKVWARLEGPLHPDAERPPQPACARRSTSATWSPRSKARRSIFTRTSIASAG